MPELKFSKTLIFPVDSLKVTKSSKFELFSYLKYFSVFIIRKWRLLLVLNLIKERIKEKKR